MSTEQNMITRFRGEYQFLSNFYPVGITYENAVYPTVEHAFQAAKCVKESDREKIRNTQKPGGAKRIGRRVELRSDWENKKVSIMEQLLRNKFESTRMKKLLKDTDRKQIIEKNKWHDNFWGTCDCRSHKDKVGKNVLGKLLMKIRDEILKESN